MEEPKNFKGVERIAKSLGTNPDSGAKGAEEFIAKMETKVPDIYSDHYASPSDFAEGFLLSGGIDLDLVHEVHAGDSTFHVYGVRNATAGALGEIIVAQQEFNTTHFYRKFASLSEADAELETIARSRGAQ